MTRRGKPAVVVVAADEFERMKKRQISLKDLLRSAPWHELEIERDKSYPREIDL